MWKFGRLFILATLTSKAYAASGYSDINKAYPYKPNINTDEVQCHSEGTPKFKTLNELYTNVEKVFNPNACYREPATFENPYSPDYCKKILSCSAEFLNEGDKISLRQMTAEAEVRSRLRDIAPKMEKLEKARLFAEENGMGEMVKSCPSRFALSSQKNSRSCNRIFTKVFRELNPNEKGVDYQDFIEETSGKKRNSFIQYFQNRLKYSINLFKNGQDSSNIKIYSEIMTKKNPAELKKAEFLQEIDKREESFLNDPILGFKNASIEFDQKHAEFIDGLIKNENLDEEQFKTAFLDYRKRLAKEIFSNPVICNPAETYESLCDDVTNILNGQRIPKNTAQMVSKLNSEIKENHYFAPDEKNFMESLKNLIGKKHSPSDQMVRLVAEAGKCQAYVVSPEARRTDEDIDYTLKPIPTARAVDKEGNSIPNDDRITKYYKKLKQTEGIASSNDALSSNSSSSGTKKDEADSHKMLPTSSVATNPSGITSTVSSPLPIMPSSATNYSSIPNDNYPSDSDLQKNAAQVASSASQKSSVAASSSNPQNKALEAQIKDLSARMELANSNIKNLTAAKEAAEKLAQQNGQSNTTALNTIRDQQLKRAQDDFAQAKEEIERLKRSSGAPARSVANDASVKSYDEYGPFNKSYSSSPTSSYSANSNPGSESGKTARATKSVALLSGTSSQEVITLNSDQSRTPDAFQKDILDMIMTKQGESFLIKEGGVTLRIIPQVENNQVLLDSQGLPLYIKVLENQKTEENTGRADVIYNDQLVERIKYGDLKAPVQKAIGGHRLDESKPIKLLP